MAVEQGRIVASVGGETPSAEGGGDAGQRGEPQQRSAAFRQVFPSGETRGSLQGDEGHEHADGEVDKHRMEMTDELKEVGGARLHREILGSVLYCRVSMIEARLGTAGSKK
jgi:hypothetical protein